MTRSGSKPTSAAASNSTSSSISTRPPDAGRMGARIVPHLRASDPRRPHARRLRASLGDARPAEARRVRAPAYHTRGDRRVRRRAPPRRPCDATVRKVLSLVQGVLRRPLVLGRIRANPVGPVRKPVQGRTLAVRPLIPATVEQLRRLMPSGEDATLVSVLAMPGSGPGRLLPSPGVTWASGRSSLNVPSRSAR